jgi:signal transduction histidine kinase
MLLVWPLFIQAQRINIDSLVQVSNHLKNDTSKMIYFRTISRIYAELNPDSAYYYSEKTLQLARQMNFKLDETSALREMGYALLNRSNYPRSLQTILSALAIVENPESEKVVLVGEFPGDDPISHRKASPQLQRLSEIGFTHQIMGILYANSNNFEKSKYHHLLARQYAEQSGNIPLLSIVNQTLNRVYINLKNLDSAMISIQRANELIGVSGYYRYYGSVLLNTGRTYAALGNQPKAIEYYRKALTASTELGYYRGVVASNLLLADYYNASAKNDSALLSIRNALSMSQTLNAPDLLLRSYTSFTKYYRTTHNTDSIVKYQAMIITINDSLFNAKQAQQFQNIDFDEQQRQQQIAATEKQYKAKLQRNILLGSLGTFFLAALLLWRNIRQRKRSSTILQKQKEELEIALTTLKTTQKQLIQSEKMASLGELTAGIAHEIQNPLNFVNNFSEVNIELIDEMNEKFKLGKNNEAVELAEDIKQNNEKINFHGKRADSIVKGMLQHSRSSSGQKEMTDINNLADECLRLSFHGMRAKDKSFNVKTETIFDNSIPPVNISSQDIGRVLLNLFTNSFYSVTQKRQKLGETFEPEISVKTAKTTKGIIISIRDNGNGIPQKVLDKVFQPFFTTKPTGEGTGLGLSMSYDIITKGHNGELKVETKEGEYAEFIITLPV